MVELNPFLSDYAQIRAEEMDSAGYIWHSYDFVYGRAVEGHCLGEILARNVTLYSAVQAWGASPSHNNILYDSSFTEAGVGVSGSTWVVIFGKDCYA